MNLKTGVPRQWPPWHEAPNQLQQLLATGREVNQIRVQAWCAKKLDWWCKVAGVSKWWLSYCFFCLLYLSASTTAACYTEYMHLVTSEYTCFDLPPTLHPSAEHWHRLILGWNIPVSLENVDQGRGARIRNVFRSWVHVCECVRVDWCCT